MALRRRKKTFQVRKIEATDVRSHLTAPFRAACILFARMSHRLSHTATGIQLGEQFARTAVRYSTPKNNKNNTRHDTMPLSVQSPAFFMPARRYNSNHLKIHRSLGAGLDCVSINEVRLG
jgi:hypothetical protein